MSPALIGISILLFVILCVVWSRARVARRAEFIRHYTYPKGFFLKLQKQYPELTLKDCQLVGNALRQFFLAHLHSGRKFVSMPSQVTDALWHELILYTRNYEQFCRQAFGRFMHHTPAVVLGLNRLDNSGLRRCWWHVCKEENIDPNHPSRLPLLFAIDAKLGIANGFRYVTDCESLRKGGDGSVYCGGDFSDSGIDGGTDGLGDSGAEAGGDSGCGGGCGGD